MGKMCYICRRKASQRDRVSLFMIPKDPIARHKWMQVCNLLPTDDLKCIYMCSMHFSAKHIDQGNQYQTRCTLKIGAIPSIGVPNPSSSNNENTNIINNGNENKMEMNEVKTTNKYENINMLDDEVLHVNTLDNVDDHIYAQELQSSIHPFDEVSSEQFDNCMKRRRLNTADVTMDGEVDNDFEESNRSYCTTPKRRVFEPRYVSEIEVSDFGTPKRTRRILNLVRDTDTRKSKLIKSLQDRNRKLERQISSLQQIIAHLKEEKMIANDNGYTLLGIANKSDHSYATIMHSKNNRNNAHTSAKKSNHNLRDYSRLF